jgi:hypothetical protein
MTSTSLAPFGSVQPQASPALKGPRWFGVAFGLLLGLAAVCHGCHAGDHDDELSVPGNPHVVGRKEKPLLTHPSRARSAAE